MYSGFCFAHITSPNAAAALGAIEIYPHFAARRLPLVDHHSGSGVGSPKWWEGEGLGLDLLSDLGVGAGASA